MGTVSAMAGAREGGTEEAQLHSPEYKEIIPQSLRVSRRQAAEIPAGCGHRCPVHPMKPHGHTLL